MTQTLLFPIQYNVPNSITQPNNDYFPVLKVQGMTGEGSRERVNLRPEVPFTASLVKPIIMASHVRHSSFPPGWLPSQFGKCRYLVCVTPPTLSLLPIWLCVRNSPTSREFLPVSSPPRCPCLGLHVRNNIILYRSTI